MAKNNDWTWDEQKRNIGPFFLDGPVSSVSAYLCKLERYEYEDYDTYLIKESNWSKIFAENDRIVSIQCALHFIANGNDLIGKTLEESQNALHTQLEVYPANEDIMDCFNLQQTLKLIINKNMVQYVVFSSLWQKTS